MNLVLIESEELDDRLDQAVARGYQLARNELSPKPTGIWLKVDQVAHIFEKSPGSVRRVLKRNGFNVEGKCEQRSKGKSWEVNLLSSVLRWEDVR